MVQKTMIEFVKASASIGSPWISGSPPKKLLKKITCLFIPFSIKETFQQPQLNQP